MFYKRITFQQKYGKSGETYLLDSLCTDYEFVVLEDEEGNEYRLDMQTKEVERYSIEELVRLYIQDIENRMGIADTDYEDHLFKLRLFCIDQFGGFYSNRIRDEEEYYAELNEQMEKENN